MSKQFQRTVMWGIGTMALGLAFAAGTYALDDGQRAQATTSSPMWVYAIYQAPLSKGALTGVDQDFKATNRKIVFTDNSPGTRVIPAYCKSSTQTSPITITTNTSTNVIGAGAPRMAMTLGVDVADEIELNPGSQISFSSTTSSSEGSTQQIGRTRYCCINIKTGEVWGGVNSNNNNVPWFVGDASCNSNNAAEALSFEFDMDPTTTEADKFYVTGHKAPIKY